MSSSEERRNEEKRREKVFNHLESKVFRREK